MPSWLESLLLSMEGLPPAALYFVLALAAAVENIIPPVPADVVVVFGGFLAGRGVMPWPLAFFSVWAGNVAGALLVYWAGRRYGTAFFHNRIGRLLLRPRQLEQLSAFYQRYGTGVVFVSRFLPMFRAVVPVFAGISGLGFWRTAVPLASASAIWYGALVYGGASAGRNWERVVELLTSTGRWLWALTLIVFVALLWRWYKSR